MAEIRFRSDVSVSLVRSWGSDRDIVEDAQARDPGTSAADDRIAPVLRSVLQRKIVHTSPFEHSGMSVHVDAPAVVWWEWTRHRFMPQSRADHCLAGDTVITLGRLGTDGKPELRYRTIAEIYRYWHEGVPYRYGGGCVRALPSGRFQYRVRHGSGSVAHGTFDDFASADLARREFVSTLPPVRHRLRSSHRSVTARVLNEDTHFCEFGSIADVYESGVQELLSVRAATGHSLRCTRNHKLLTPDGWVKAGDLTGGEMVAVVGKKTIRPERTIPLRLRQGIGLWTSQQRSRLIRDTDECHVCGRSLPRCDLILDHVVPVAACLRMSLDERNLSPICGPCNVLKVADEQKLAVRGTKAGSKFVKLLARPEPVATEMTYDIEMTDPWHNFVANNFIVHNSFNLESGRYRKLRPVFYLSPDDRPIREPDGFKPMRPNHLVDPALAMEVRESQESVFRAAWASYEFQLSIGVAREVARNVLGPAVYYAGRVSGGVLTWLHFLALRTRDNPDTPSSYPQWEIERVALRCEELFAGLFPLTHAAWVEYGRACP